MSPFRDAPEIELGPLDVGLEVAATRAMSSVPRGGRVIDRVDRGPSHLVGAVGSAGVLSVALLAIAAWSASWRPQSALDLAFCAGAVLLGGVSLAIVWSAIDHGSRARSRPGDVVGARASDVLRRLSRVAALMRRGRLDAERILALRRAIAAADDAAVATWVPRDVRGRAELLLGRAIAAGGRGAASATARREITLLLTRAAEHLDDPDPALADLSALERAPQRLARGLRVDGDALEIGDGEDDRCASSERARGLL